MDEVEALYWTAIDNVTARRDFEALRGLMFELSTHLQLTKPPHIVIEW